MAKRKTAVVADPELESRLKKRQTLILQCHVYWTSFSLVEKRQEWVKARLQREHHAYYTINSLTKASSSDWTRYRDEEHVVIVDVHKIKKGTSRADRVKFVIDNIATTLQFQVKKDFDISKIENKITHCHLILPALERTIESPRLFKNQEQELYQLEVKCGNENLIETEYEWYSRIMSQFYDQQAFAILEQNTRWLKDVHISDVLVDLTLYKRFKRIRNQDMEDSIKQSNFYDSETKMVKLMPEQYEGAMETFILPELYYLHYVHDKIPLSLRLCPR